MGVGYGWTPAYSIQSILVQLQAFLFDKVDTGYYATSRYSYYGGSSTTTRSRNEAKQFRCEKCNHNGRKPWPQPLAWKDRLKYIVPSREHVDVAKTRNDFYHFLSNVNGMLYRNQWPRIVPLAAGSFFGRTLLPWHDGG